MQLYNIILTSLLLLIKLHHQTHALPAINDGKYHAKKYGNSGKYKHDDSGKYVSDVHKYRYVHIHIPYDGGYGPYYGIPNPYLHDGRDALPYIHNAPPPVPYVHQTDKYGYAQELDKYPYTQVPDKYPYKQTPDKYPYEQKPDKYPYKQDDSKSASTNVVDPFKTNVYVIPKPKIIREYGPPLFDPTNNVDVRFRKEKESVGTKDVEKKLKDKSSNTPKFIIKA